MTQQKKYHLRLNSLDKVEQLLQEAYDSAKMQVIEIDTEMNKLRNSTMLKDLTVEEKAKYGKVMHDFFGDKEKANRLKLDIAKFMGEIIKYDGNVGKAANDPNVVSNTMLDLDQIRNAIKETMADDVAPTTYELKNRNKI